MQFEDQNKALLILGGIAATLLGAVITLAVMLSHASGMTAAPVPLAAGLAPVKPSPFTAAPRTDTSSDAATWNAIGAEMQRERNQPVTRVYAPAQHPLPAPVMAMPAMPPLVMARSAPPQAAAVPQNRTGLCDLCDNPAVAEISVDGHQSARCAAHLPGGYSAYANAMSPGQAAQSAPEPRVPAGSSARLPDSGYAFDGLGGSYGGEQGGRAGASGYPTNPNEHYVHNSHVRGGGYWATNANHTTLDNFSHRGNYNYHTGAIGHRR